VNKWVKKGLLPDKKHVTVREILLEHSGSSRDGLDYASKLDRQPEFIEGLLLRGKTAATRFMAGIEE
jgi:hypothetical protein